MNQQLSAFIKRSTLSICNYSQICGEKSAVTKIRPTVQSPTRSLLKCTTAALLVFSQLYSSDYTLAANPTTPGGAPTAVKNPIVPKPNPTPLAFVVNPENLRRQLIEGNFTVKTAMNHVYTAKTQVTNQRMALLPSINIGALLSGPAGFSISAISMLLPFLMPSNWFNLAESKHLFKAEEEGYHALQLDTYASAYALYLTLVTDQELKVALEKQYQNLKNIENIVRAQYELGLVPQSDLQQASAQVQTIQIQVSTANELILRENAAVREMLAFPLSTKITYEHGHLAGIPEENYTPQLVLDKTLSVSPEKKQIGELILAAKDAKWSRAFSFLSGSSLNAQFSKSGSGTGSFSGITQSGQVNLGFGLFTEVKLSNLHTQELMLRSQEINFEQAQTIEATMGSIAEAKTQVELAGEAETNFNNSYLAEVEKFKMGATDLLHVLTASNYVITGSVNKIKALKDLDTLRVTMLRILIQKEFATIKKCSLEQVGKIAPKGPFKWLFQRGNDNGKEGGNFAMEEACRNSSTPIHD